MRHLIFRIFYIIIISFILIITVFPWSYFGINIPFSWKEYKLWLDLQWWIELDYKIDLEELRDSEDYDKTKEKEVIEWLKSIIDKRVQTLKINDSEINDSSYAWEKHIIVQIPLKWNDSFENKENIQRAKDAIWKVVKIVFKEKRSLIIQEDLIIRKNLAEKALAELKKWESFKLLWDKYSIWYEKVISWNVENFSQILISTGSILNNTINEVTYIDWEEWYLLADNETKNYLFISSTPSEWIDAKDAEWRTLDDKYFVKSTVQLNEVFIPMIELVFNSEWAKIFAELSERLVGQQMAIFVWWELLTAPVINETIYWWKAVITWNYTVEEANSLSNNINTWVVPAPIYLTSEKTIDSKIWLNSLNKLIYAWVLGLILIFVFLVIVYRLSWLFASISLFLYVLAILFIVKIFSIVLTLASIAGLILSIWMAIDANILIFERVRDELKKGKDILSATDIWFKKSWTAIWDSNITWLIVAFILFIFWINLIKGFWLMLWLWIVVSLFTVMFISKVFIITLALKIKNKKYFVWFKEIKKD